MNLKSFILAAGCLGLSAGALAKPVEIEDLAKYPAVSGLSMSMEGDTIVGTVWKPGSNGEDTAIASWDISGVIDTTKPLAPMAITPGNDRMSLVSARALKGGIVQVVGRQAWTGPTVGCLEGRTVGAERTFVNKAYGTDKTLKDFKELFSKPSAKRVNAAMEQCERLQASTSSIRSVLPLDDDHILISRFQDGANRFIRYNIKTEAETVLFRQGDRAPVLLDGRTSEVLATQRAEPDGSGDYDIEYQLLNPASGSLELATGLTSKASNRFSVDVGGVDDATGKYYVITDKFSDKAAVYLYDIRSQEFDSEPLFQVDGFSVTGVILSQRKADFNALVGFSIGGPTARERYYVDPEVGGVYEGLAAAFPSLNVSILGYNEDMSRVLFSTWSSANPSSYYLLVDKSRVAVIGASQPWIDTASLRETEFVKYTARDGLEIPGFLTLPKNWKKEDGPLPAIVLPHGGPWSRDTSAWDSSGWPQFLASRGYAVLQPQYRGSTGFGRKLWLEGDAEWGLKMQDDKDDGAAWLVTEGIAAPDRIAIFGYSYGGFAAMAAVVRPDGPFQCAIAGAGVSNLAKLGNNWSDNRLQRAIQGQTVKGMDPLANADKANIPILVYHGDRDVRVPIFHGKDFYEAVRRKVKAEWVQIADMPHSLPWWPDHHRKSLSAIESFLKNDCGPGGL
ncbi:prolyl oligopeptidase family serine peptidase [Hyphomonas sp.]|uniref:alpha/beta hydrolase family protein n=1 Tax=Hyphomonas sp. TaxID=87 RepID=UPI00261D9F54|nr:prolyl oligopeptidase family serine peptidase [Hyphomonas sp.]